MFHQRDNHSDLGQDSWPGTNRPEPDGPALGRLRAHFRPFRLTLLRRRGDTSPSTGCRRPSTQRGFRPTPVAWASRGQSLVEFALILPVFLVLLGTAIDAGRMFFSYVAITNGAREGAIYGGMNPECDTASACPNPNNVTYRVTQETGSGVTVAVACFAPDGTPRSGLAACTKGDIYRVRVERPFALLTPFVRVFFGDSVTLGAEANAVVFNPAAYNSPTPTPTATPTPTPTPAPTPTPVATPSCTAPTGNFTSIPAPGSNGRVMVNVGQTVTFTGTSNPAPTSWLWTFGDGATNATNWPTVSHAWSSKGKFTVTLTLRTSDSDLTCATTITKTEYVQVN